MWLDAKVEALDDVSNGQIGAPDAWAAGHDGTGATVGIIDTGVDRTHPDLAGRIVEAQNFVEAGFPGGGVPDDVTDRHGHGTHVASTVAGSGAASGGRYEGVAPGTKLVIAKALDDNGEGSNSAIIAAMEWEAQRVDVVSMSLGGNPTDGTDPLSTAVNELTAQLRHPVRDRRRQLRAGQLHRRRAGCGGRRTHRRRGRQRRQDRRLLQPRAPHRRPRDQAGDHRPGRGHRRRTRRGHRAWALR